MPLDSRPCCYEYPKELMQYTNLDVVTIDRDLMDFYGNASNYEIIKNWLLEHNKQCDFMVISVEQLVYGGLISSRKMNIKVDEALKRLAVIQQLKKANPKAKIYLTNTIMRTSISTLKKEDVIYWDKISKYISYMNGNEEEIKQAEQLKLDIPEDILNEFMSVRNRNHEINLACLAYLKEEIVESVIYLQEDSTPNGMHRLEQSKILERANELNVYDRVFMHNGTDEIATALLGYLQALENGNQLKLYVDWLNPKSKDFIAKYEDRPFDENLKGYLKTLKIKNTSLEECNQILIVYPPKGRQGDLCVDRNVVNEEYTDLELQEIVNKIKAYIEKGYIVNLLDIKNANGGDLRLIDLLIQEGIWDKIYGYGAWNTATNSLGMLLGEMLCYPCMKEKHIKTIKMRHLIDDGLYQSCVRNQLKSILEGNNEDIWNIKDVVNANESLQEQLQYELQIRGMEDCLFIAKLYWPRLFEVQIKVLER